MSQTQQSQQIYKSRINILEMMSQQGYNVTEYTGSSIHEVHSMLNSKQLDMLLSRNEPVPKKIYIKYHLGKTLRLKDINEFIEDLFKIEEHLTKDDDLIIIAKDEPNETLVKTINTIWEQENINISIIGIRLLQFNIMEHHLVPPHRALVDKEAQEIKNKYNITSNSQIPDISRHSLIAQIIGLRPGMLCEITRPSNTSINTKFYRVCS